MKTHARSERPVGSPASLEVHIEELVLYGFPPADRQRLAEAVERELQLWFSGNPLPSAWESGLEVESINAGEFAASLRAPVNQMGTNLARTLWSGFNSSAPESGGKPKP